MGGEGVGGCGGMGGCEGVSKNRAREKEKIVPRDAGSNFTLYVY